jgi:hypothetical protein
MSAGRKVPEPSTSGLAAASSDAMVTARTLVSPNKKVARVGYGSKHTLRWHHLAYRRLQASYSFGTLLSRQQPHRKPPHMCQPYTLNLLCAPEARARCQV